MRTVKSSTLLSLFILTAMSPSSSSVVFASFTAKDMLAAPRSGPAIPSPNGTLAVYTESTYSFESDSKSGGIYLLPIDTEQSHSSTSKVLINDTNASDPAWLDDRTILYIRTKSGESSLHTYDIESSSDHEIHCFPGQIGDLKILSIKKNTSRIAFSAKVTPHGN